MEDSQQKGARPISINNLLEDLDISSSSGSCEEQPCLAAARVKEGWNPPPGPSTTKVCTPQSTINELNYSLTSREILAKVADQKAATKHRDSEHHKLIDLGLDYDSLTSDTDDQEGSAGHTNSRVNSPQSKNNPCNTKPWTMKDVIRLLKGMKKQLPKMDNKGCLYTAKKIDWERVAFDCFTAEDCKKEFEILLNSIKLMKTLTAVINELEEKIPRGKLKTFLVLQPRQQFVRDFAEKNKGLITGSNLFAATAEAWKKLPPEEKEQYTRNYILAKEKEIACMSADEPPLRPKIPFELYYEDLCKKKGKKNLELKTMAREKYKNLNPKKKIKYIALSAIELYTYELQVARYLKKQPDWDVPVQRGPSKEDSEMYLKSLGMPPRPPNTASLLYYHQKLKAGKLDHIHGTTRLFHATEQFRRLSEHKKRKYIQKSKEMLEVYAVEYGMWRKKQSEVVRRLADKLLGKKQVLPSGTLCRLQNDFREKELSMTNEGKLDREDFHLQESERPCCRHLWEHEPDEQLSEASQDRNLPSPDMEKLKQICKQDAFFNVDQSLEEKMDKISLMVSGYEYLPNKARKKFDSAFKKWKYSLQAAIIVDVRSLKRSEQQEFLMKYRSLCKRFFKRDIFCTMFPVEKNPSSTKSPLSQSSV